MLGPLTVNTIQDFVEANGDPIRDDGWLTLRDAIAYVNQDFPPLQNDIESGGVVHIDLTEPFGTNDTIHFAEDLFTASGAPTKATIVLTEDANDSSALIVSEDVVIEAPEGYELEVSAAGLNRRVFYVNGSGTLIDVTLRNVAITGDGCWPTFPNYAVARILCARGARLSPQAC